MIDQAIRQDIPKPIPKPIPKMVHKVTTDIYRFMTNLMIYALKYGGNTDRSEYKE